MAYDLEFEKPLAELEKKIAHLKRKGERLKSEERFQLQEAERELPRRTEEIYKKLQFMANGTCCPPQGSAIFA